jgi:hypothetical protein
MDSTPTALSFSRSHLFADGTANISTGGNAVVFPGAKIETECTKSTQGHDRQGDERRYHFACSHRDRSGHLITASITNEAVADLALQKGNAAWAVIKASDVMIGK